MILFQGIDGQLNVFGVVFNEKDAFEGHYDDS
jgi:hypothetical protein